jgi:hypothetical protein
MNSGPQYGHGGNSVYGNHAQSLGPQLTADPRTAVAQPELFDVSNCSPVDPAIFEPAASMEQEFGEFDDSLDRPQFG